MDLTKECKKKGLNCYSLAREISDLGKSVSPVTVWRWMSNGSITRDEKYLGALEAIFGVKDATVFFMKNFRKKK